jgi:hypothetical protein
MMRRIVCAVRSGAMSVALILAACATLGCVRGCPSSRPPIHPNPNMDYQEKYQPFESSGFFYDGSAMRLPVPGTVARGALHEDESIYTGRDAAGEFLATVPIAATDEILEHGAKRFAIYCRPCHDKRGTGQGILTERGGVPVPSFHEQRIVDLADGEMFDVATNGKGLMQGYRYPVPAADRWAIILHIRRLQREALVAEGLR